YSVRFPFLDLAEVSAGGGTIAHVDAGGALRVGPMSAGADPGPVCYGRGGADPTVTDAHLLLGRLNPAHLLGGAMPVDRDAAMRAMAALARRLDRPLKVAPVRPVLTAAVEAHPHELAALLAAMEAEAVSELTRQGAAPATIKVAHTLDLRYTGQSYELAVPAEPGTGEWVDGVV